jgi:hypothetical protein
MVLLMVRVGEGVLIVSLAADAEADPAGAAAKVRPVAKGPE